MQHQIISTIRHSLNAAQSALTLLESLQGVDLGHERPAIQTPQVEQPAEAVEDVENDEAVEAVEHVETVDTPAVPAAPAAVPSTFDVLMSELNHPRYTLRTVSELTKKLGVPYGNLIVLLEENEIEYVIRHRSSDGAKLIGLDERN